MAGWGWGHFKSAQAAQVGPLQGVIPSPGATRLGVPGRDRRRRFNRGRRVPARHCRTFPRCRYRERRSGPGFVDQCLSGVHLHSGLHVCPAAGQQLGFAGTGIGCPTRPPGEQVNWISGSPNDSGPIVDDEIGFLDPPGLKGTGFPSGGNNPANGVVLYRFMSGTGGTSAIETCTLPTSDHSLCTAVLNDFAGRSWQVGP